MESSLGAGAAFTLYLPRAYPGDRAIPTAGEGAASVDGEDLCVLLVEDNEQVGAFATQALRELGYRSVLASNAAKALAELEKGHDRFHILFSDVVMPGMSGVELANEVRRRYADVPVVLASGYSHVLAHDGAHGFELLHKPYSVEQLSRVLRKVSAQGRVRSMPDAAG